VTCGGEEALPAGSGLGKRLVEPCDSSYSFRVKFPYNLTIGNLWIAFQCLDDLDNFISSHVSCMQPDGLGAKMGHQTRMMTTITLSKDLKKLDRG